MSKEIPGIGKPLLTKRLTLFRGPGEKGRNLLIDRLAVTLGTGLLVSVVFADCHQ